MKERNTTCRHGWTTLVCGFLFLTVSAVEIPELDKIPLDLRLPAFPSLATDAAGNFLVNGKIRYLLGMEVNTGMKRDLLPTEGYPDALRWIYEQPLNYERAQRLGFDSLGVFNLTDFLKKYQRNYRDSFCSPENIRLNQEIWGAGLPLYVDFTCFPWTNGMLANAKHFPGALPPDGLNAYREGVGNHWVPYNIFHPAAREAYRAYWESGTRFALSQKSPIVAYELFNEPAYDDPGEYNRKLFALALEKKYRTVENMNRVWRSRYESFEKAAHFRYKTETPGLFVDWSKFMEAGFTDLCRFGRDVIRKMDPQARICVQSLAGGGCRAVTNSNVNLYEISRILNAVTTPTGGYAGNIGNGLTAPASPTVATPDSGAGEGFLSRHFLRAIADGKPIINSEAYTGKSVESISNVVWRDLLLGSNATYLFEWSKRAWDFKPAGSADGGRKIAERFPWMILNPYAFAPENMTAFLKVKQEVFRFAKFFVPRERGIARQVALMVSLPTERYGACVGGMSARHDIATFAAALEFAHYPADAILEEQLPENRASRYRMLIAAGMRNVYPDTVARLKSFVREGGILLLARDFPVQDEYGNPLKNPLLEDLPVMRDAADAPTGTLSLKFPQERLLPGKIACRNLREIVAASGWEVEGTVDGKPALLSRRIGKGMVYFLSATMQDYAAAAVVGGLLRRHGITPTADVLRTEAEELAANVEVCVAKRGECVAAFLFNHDGFAKAVRVVISGRMASVDLLRKRKLENGVILLPARSYRIVGVGAPEAFGEYGPFEFGSATGEITRAESLNREAAEKRLKSVVDAPLYSANPARLKPLDLRNFCNRGFIDHRPGDGKGGWTDQGEDNSLVGVPWGVQDLRGIPCDLIRWDQNENRTCIVLSSLNQSGALPDEVKGIPVSAPTKALYFFHAAAWAERGKLALTYRIHYADGTFLNIPVRCGDEIWDWWMRSGFSQAAWKNRMGRGFFVWRWENPHPEKEIVSIDLLSARNQVVPLVLGITLERYEASEEPVRLPLVMEKSKAYDTGIEIVNSRKIRVVVREKSKPWSGVIVPLEKSLSPVAEKTVLAFRIRGDLDRFGNPCDGQLLQIHLAAKKGKGWKRLTQITGLQPFLVNARKLSAESWTEVRIPLDKLRWSKHLQPVEVVMLQFMGNGNKSGILLENMRFEILK